MPVADVGDIRVDDANINKRIVIGSRPLEIIIGNMISDNGLSVSCKNGPSVVVKIASRQEVNGNAISIYTYQYH